NSAALSMRERQMVEQLVIALRQLENMFWRQSDPEGLALYKALAKVNTPLAQKTRHYLWINGSRWDLVNENEPFVGKQPRPPGHALFTDDYFASDIAWVELNNPKFDVIYAPYETYLDDLLGVKTSYGASILIRNDAESQKLALYQKWVPDIQDALPLAPADR